MKGIKALAGALAEVDRRIDNMNFLMRFQVEKRERILTSMRETLGRTFPQTIPLAFPVVDETPDCPQCGHPFDNAADVREISLIAGQDGSAHVVIAADEPLVAMGVLLAPEGCTYAGRGRLHTACAETIGIDRKREDTPKKTRGTTKD